MYRSRIFVFLLLVVTMTLSGCAGGKMGDLLTPPALNVSASNTPIVVSIKATGDKYHYPKAPQVASMAKQVFGQYGWRVIDSDDAPIIITLKTKRDGYAYPEFMLLYFLSVGTLPGKGEGYVTTEAIVEINGVPQETFTYTSNNTGYITCYTPIALMMPGVTEHTVGLGDPPTGLASQSLKMTLQHIAEDIKAKYLSGNYQRAHI